MANLRGSKEYFAKLGLEIKWMIRNLAWSTNTLCDLQHS